MGILLSKRILITGISNKYSIGYGIAKVLYREGAQLAFSYHNKKLMNRIKNLTSNFKSNIIFPCDVENDISIKKFFIYLSKFWPKFDGFVHSIAYAPKNQLTGNYVNTVTREGFLVAQNISAYSFVAMAKACQLMLNKGSALLTLSYLGAERVMPCYNVMGLAKAALEANTRYMAYSMGSQKIRVNAISAGPIRTVAAYNIRNFKKILSKYEKSIPINRMVTIEDIGNAAAFLCSNLSSGITGEILHVDGGFNIIL